MNANFESEASRKRSPEGSDCVDVPSGDARSIYIQVMAEIVKELDPGDRIRCWGQVVNTIVAWSTLRFECLEDAYVTQSMGECPETSSMEEMCTANDWDWEVVGALTQLQIGQEHPFGGGAMAETTVRRLA